MKVRYSKQAARQIDAALSYIQARSAVGADRVRRRLLLILEMLEHHPNVGHPTDRDGVLRIGVPPYPFIIDYRINEAHVVILRFRHTARRPSS